MSVSPHRLARKLLPILAFVILSALLSSAVWSGAHSAQAATPVFINEIHYDNAGGDVNEGIEVAGPAGSDLSGWSLVAYNGSNGGSYSVTSLSGLIPNQQDGCGAIFFPITGLQNGDPDGVALVAPGDVVVQFLSYEGSFMASDGPANGLTSVDIGVSELGSTPIGDSLQLAGTGSEYEDFTWSGPVGSTYDAVNAGQTFTCGGGGEGDLGIAKAGPQYAVAAAGETLVYTITLNNQAAASAANIVVTDTLPANTTYVSDSSGVAPANPAPGVYVWSLPDVPAASVVSFSLTAAIDAAPASGDTFTNNVEVSTDLVGDDPANNSASVQTTVYPLVTIYDVQTVPDPASDDASPLEGQAVWVEGVVTAAPGEVDTPTRAVVIQDSMGGPFSGLILFKSSGFGGLAAPEGTRVRALGAVSEFFGLTELNLSGSPAAVEVLGAEMPLAPAVLATSAFDDVDPAVSEQWESVLIEFQDAVVTDDDLGFGEWQFDDSSGPARADDLGNRDGNLTYSPANGDEYRFIRGIGWYSFDNYKLQPRYDADVGLVLDLVINELLADPHPDSPPADPNGDANGDGDRNGSEDEFVEIVNAGDADIDLSGWSLRDAVALRHTFPADTVVPAGCAVVVFGGGAPTGSFGGSVVQTASEGFLGLNNGGDSITLFDLSATPVISYTYGSEGDNDQSLTRDPDIVGPEPLVGHSTATGSGGALFSPGTQIDGSLFAGCTPPSALNIGQVQGAIPDELADPASHASPYVGQTVRIGGVVADLIQTRSSGGTTFYGFFLQEEPDESDGDPLTSDGIFANMDTSPSFDSYTPAIGDKIVVEGGVSEFFGNTRISNLALINATLAYTEDIDVALPAAEVPADGSQLDYDRFYERHEGMRVFIPAGAAAVSADHLFQSTNDTEAYFLHPDNPVAQRPNIYERRVFRDPHPLDNGLVDGNPQRISVEANVLKGNGADYDIQMPAITAYDVATNTIVGPIVYAFDRYTLQTEVAPAMLALADPSANYPVNAGDPLMECSLSTFNIENLYDYYNDPGDGCDFEGDPGCPGVFPPFNYVPPSQMAYSVKIHKLALAIVDYMHSPDIVSIQEAEDQDVCTGGGSLSGICGDAMSGDGMPDVLQDLADRISTLTGGAITYLTANDRDGADDRGIIQGYLYRADRVELPPADPNDPLLGSRPLDPYAATYPYNQDVENPKVLNANYTGDPDGEPAALFSRPLQVALFRIYPNGVGDPDFVDIYTLDNHFKSVPDDFVQRRTQQAQFNANLVDELLAANPDARIAVLGDLNVFPDYDQLAPLYVQMDNLIYEIPAQARFSYVFAGQTQTLDQIFATAALTNTLVEIRAAHINADYSETLASNQDVAFRSSDHDPVVARFLCEIPTAVALSAFSAARAASPAAGLPWPAVVGAAAMALGVIALRRR